MNPAVEGAERPLEPDLRISNRTVRRTQPIVRKRHGFPGQHHLIVPGDVARAAVGDPLLRPLLPTAAGYFPHAEGHFVVRPEGVPETIIILCAAGRGWFEVGGRRQTVQAGDTVFIPPEAPHAYGADDDDPWSIVWAHAVGSELGRYMTVLGISATSRKLRLSADAVERLGFDRVWQVLEEGYSLPFLLVSASSLRVVLAEMVRNRLAPREPRSNEPDAVQRTAEWMRQNVAARPSLAELARLTGTSASHLTALFRSKAGYPPMNYFSRLKIQHACRLLDTTNAQIKQIGTEIGYPDPYYFSRLFRHVMGMSPRAYRAAPKG